MIERLYRERADWLKQGSAKHLGDGAKKLVIRFEQLQKSDCESEVKGVYRVPGTHRLRHRTGPLERAAKP